MSRGLQDAEEFTTHLIVGKRRKAGKAGWCNHNKLFPNTEYCKSRDTCTEYVQQYISQHCSS